MEEIITVEDNRKKRRAKKRCCKINMPCAKFVTASIFSLSGLVIGTCLIFMYPQDTKLMPIGLSLVTGNISVWIKMPKYNER
jgi:hypothetical protein